MLKPSILSLLIGLAVSSPSTVATSDEKSLPAPPPGKVRWDRFRGPDGQGVAPADRLPVRFGPEKNVSWRIATPPGHSSPVIWNDRIFLTVFEPTDARQLITLCIDRGDGKILWRQAVRADAPGRFHPLNRPASSTPAADDRHVYA